MLYAWNLLKERVETVTRIVRTAGAARFIGGESAHIFLKACRSGKDFFGCTVCDTATRFL